MDPSTYDLVVIGSGPAGQKAAIAAAKLGKRVAVVDRKSMIGGVSVHTGTIPSKTLREAILYLTGFRQRTFYGRDYTLKETISVPDLIFRVHAVLERETDVVHRQFRRNNIVLIYGTARFLEPHVVEVEGPGGRETLKGDFILVSCGTRPAHSPQIEVDGRTVFDSDQLLDVPSIPRDLIVVGGGVVGLEYASMLGALDVRITIIDLRPALLEFVDREIVDALCYQMRSRGATFRLGEKVVSVTRDERGRVVACLDSGKTVHGEGLLYAVGRQPNTDLVRLEAAGLAADEKGRIAVDGNFRTKVPHIYAAGDVVGFPSLAASSMEQGRLAASHMFGVPGKSAPEFHTYGIYTVPEISMVGKTEQELTAARVPYEFGLARYEELARGQILGDEIGLLKILFDPSTLRVLGVHGIGENATEIIHVGQAVMALGGTMEYFRDAVFNYPTLTDAYKVAALNGLNKI